ncbi:uncharacterized protein LOC107416750 [Ziziphus jujuba]|uniref:Uncharacterized protein LOC107416750 n=2 Tax=Ziziphus jujuba TaxID=326968 RepID=A0A6P3ZP14_ZIZJJ|nr:uncharacterized protein LOC107416750 [Ziziphus jujuba]KAH7532919.1 hypothetical protein FEM48_Zijuj04G0073500 [Ziziphus jujuba var. spinosa]
MGSLSPPRPRPNQQSSPPSGFQIFMSFCAKQPPSSSNDMSSNWITRYDPSNNAWERLTSIPGLLHNHVLKDFSMVSIADSVFVVGGRLYRKVFGSGQDTDDDDTGEVRSTVLRYDVRNDSWSRCAPMRVARFDFACTVYDDKIYVAGGKTTVDCTGGLSSAEVYDPALDQWKAMPSLTTGRHKCVGVTWQGKIYVVGGFAGRSGESWSILEQCSAEVYDCESAKWDLVMGMWQLDIPPNQIVAVDDRLFSCGDCLNAWKGHIESYDGKLRIWNVVDGSHRRTLSCTIDTLDDATGANWYQMQRVYLTMAAVGTHLYVLAGYRKADGGEDISSLVSVVHVFDTSVDGNGFGWKSFEPTEEHVEMELCSHCCVVRH